MIRGLQAIGHVAIRAKDIDASLDFYCNKLGLPEVHRLYRDTGELWLCYLQLNDSQIIEIFPDGQTAEAPPREATGWHHVSLTVEDLDVVVEDLAAAGVPLISPLKAGADGNRNAWIADPDGNRYELMEMHPNCIQYKALRRWKSSRATAA